MDDWQERIDRLTATLSGAVAFSRLLAEVERDAEEAGSEPVQEPQALLEQLEGLRRSAGPAPGPGSQQRLRALELGAAEVLDSLAARDESLSPSRLRLCLPPGTGLDTEALCNLIRFYLYRNPERAWTEDQIDKVDLLITKLSDSLGEGAGAPDSRRLHQILDGLFVSDERQPLGQLELDRFYANIAAIRREVEAAESLDPLLSTGTLQRYRNLKHRLGRLLLEPQILAEIVRTNLTLREVTRRLYNRAETGMLSTLQGIFDMRVSRQVDPGLRNEIDRIHDDFDRFEARVKSGNVRFGEVDQLQRSLQMLFRRLAQIEEEPAGEIAEPEPVPVASTDEGAAWLKEDLEVLLELIEEHDRSELSPAEAAYLPGGEVSLDVREIIAFRRLQNGAEGEPRFERFLLKAAALRRSIRRAARSLASSGGSESYRSQPAFERAVKAVPLAEAFLTRYSQAVNKAVLEGDLDEARSLQMLRMRLMREFAGIWLQVYLPQ